MPRHVGCIQGEEEEGGGEWRGRGSPWINSFSRLYMHVEAVLVTCCMSYLSHTQPHMLGNFLCTAWQQGSSHAVPPLVNVHGKCVAGD
jgi:hypothetical protein